VSAAVRYYLELGVRKQAVLAPVLVFVVVLAIVYATDAGPPLAAAAIPAAALVPLGAWIMRLVATSESASFADITIVAVGSPLRRQLMRATAAACIGGVLTAAACVWAVLANPHPYPPGAILEIAITTLAAAIAGIGLGALFAPPLRVGDGAAMLVVSVVVLVSLIVRWMPPLGPLLHAFIGGPPPALRRAVVGIGQAALFGVVLFALSLRLGRRGA
jgi:hypothetical protein